MGRQAPRPAEQTGKRLAFEPQIGSLDWLVMAANRVVLDCKGGDWATQPARAVWLSPTEGRGASGYTVSPGWAKGFAFLHYNVPQLAGKSATLKLVHEKKEETSCRGMLVGQGALTQTYQGSRGATHCGRSRWFPGDAVHNCQADVRFFTSSVSPNVSRPPRRLPGATRSPAQRRSPHPPRRSANGSAPIPA